MEAEPGASLTTSEAGVQVEEDSQVSTREVEEEEDGAVATVGAAEVGEAGGRKVLGRSQLDEIAFAYYTA